MSQKYRIWAALITVYIVWGSTYLAIRFAVESMPPFLMAAVRFLIAGSILFTWRWIAGDRRPSRREWRSAAIVGLLLLVGGNGGVVWAEQRVASGIAALMVGSAPLWMVTLDAIRPGGSRPNWQTIIGVVIGFLGIVLLVGPWQNTGQNGTLDTLGVLALLAAAFFWSIGSLYSRNAHLPDSPLLGTGMEMLAGGAGLLLLSTLTGEWARLDVATISLKSVLSLAYLIVFGALVGFTAYTWLLRVAPTPLVSTYAYVNPIVALYLGYMIGDEPLTLRIVAAALIVVSSVALINFSRAPTKKTESQLAASPISGND